MPAQARTRGAAPVRAEEPRPQGRVLPVAALDLERLKAMNADVRYRALDITHTHALPLQRVDLHVHLRDSVLESNPAADRHRGRGRRGAIADQRRHRPGQNVVVNLEMEGLHLNQLFPAVESTRSSLGQFNGRIDLAGDGNNVAQMLATSSGNVAMLMGEGEISNLLLEFRGP